MQLVRPDSSEDIGVTMESERSKSRPAFTLPELMATLAILAIIATIVLVRATTGVGTSKSAACQALKGDVEVQCELWRHNTGSWPAANLSNIGVDLHYFPSGAPACPVDGSVYTIDSAGRVVGHNH
jgi:prepilin-type N-terminal cleavage/methylation domain-containing protein